MQEMIFRAVSIVCGGGKEGERGEEREKERKLK
jgi:hypothetical protein